MNKDRITNVGVWVAILLGLVPLLAAAVGIPLPFNFADIVYYGLAILVSLGILSNPKDGQGFGDILRDIKKRANDDKAE